MNIKNGNVVTANYTVYNEALLLLNFFSFFSPHLWMSGFLQRTTKAHEYGNRRQKKNSYIKNSYALETFQNDNQDKVENSFENSFLFFGKFVGSRNNASEESFSKNSLGACFIKYMISLSARARLKNLEAKMPHVKKYVSQNPEKP